MKVLLIGCGKIGTCIAHDLIHNKDLELLICVDSNEIAITKLSNSLTDIDIPSDNVLITAELTSNENDFRKILSREQLDIIISAADYSLNEMLTKLAIEFKVNMIDLGGNNTVVQKQFELDEQAKMAGVTIIPDAGLAPGLVNWLAFYGLELYNKECSTKAKSIQMFVGGLPENPHNSHPPFNYNLVFSVKGLINEYIEPCLVLRNEKIIEIEPLTEIEEINDLGSYDLEAFTTSGGSSTLPYTLKDKVENLQYKTLRYPGHCKIFQALKQLGLLTGAERERTEKLLENTLKSDNEKDVVLMRVEINAYSTMFSVLHLEMIDYAHQFSAMARTTGYPTSIVAQMIVSGEIKAKGVVRGEEVIPVEKLIKKLEERDIKIKEEWF